MGHQININKIYNMLNICNCTSKIQRAKFEWEKGKLYMWYGVQYLNHTKRKNECIISTKYQNISTYLGFGYLRLGQLVWASNAGARNLRYEMLKVSMVTQVKKRQNFNQ